MQENQTTAQAPLKDTEACSPTDRDERQSLLENLKSQRERCIEELSLLTETINYLETQKSLMYHLDHLSKLNKGRGFYIP